MLHKRQIVSANPLTTTTWSEVVVVVSLSTAAALAIRLVFGLIEVLR